MGVMGGDGNNTPDALGDGAFLSDDEIFDIIRLGDVAEVSSIIIQYSRATAELDGGVTPFGILDIGFDLIQ